MYSLYFAGMYFDHPEIVPDGLLGDFRFNKSDEAVSRSDINNFLSKKSPGSATRFASNETEVRALVEGQLLAKRLHAEKIGFKITADTRILVTGGASVNLAILQVDFTIMNFVFCFFLLHNSFAGCCRCIQRQGVHTGKSPCLADCSA